MTPALSAKKNFRFCAVGNSPLNETEVRLIANALVLEICNAGALAAVLNVVEVQMAVLSNTTLA